MYLNGFRVSRFLSLDHYHHDYNLVKKNLDIFFFHHRILYTIYLSFGHLFFGLHNFKKANLKIGLLKIDLTYLM